jgi:hypothetical protein
MGVGPQATEMPDPLDGRIGGEDRAGEDRAVDRANRRSQNDVGFNRALGQSTQHADLVGPQNPASSNTKATS